MSVVEQRVLSAVEVHLLAPKIVIAALDAYRAEFAHAQGQRDGMKDRLEAELAETERKSSRLLRLVEDGHSDPVVAGPRLNELAAQKRRLASELAVRPDDAPRIEIGDSGAGYRAIAGELRSELGEGREGTAEAASLVRGLVHRITIQRRDDGDVQPIEVEAGFAGILAQPRQDCNNGCAGPQQR